jgi:hypothetical protein
MGFEHSALLGPIDGAAVVISQSRPGFDQVASGHGSGEGRSPGPSPRT